MNDFETRVVESEVEFRSTSGNSHTLGEIAGYANVFGTRSQLLSDNGRNVFVEQFLPGAFTKTLQENRNVFCYFNHDAKSVLGTRAAETLEVSQDSTGLHYRCQLPNTTAGRDAAAYIERGDVRGSSFQFIAMDEAPWDTDADTGAPLRSVKQAKLIEVSPVFSPAYLSSSVSKRSFERLARSLERDVEEIFELATTGELRSLWTIDSEQSSEEDNTEGRSKNTNGIALLEKDLELRKLRLQYGGRF